MTSPPAVVGSKPKRRRRQQPTYRHRTNAVCLTIHSPTGETIPADIRRALEDAVWAIANENKLLINIALT
jgi:hypothetical protein